MLLNILQKVIWSTIIFLSVIVLVSSVVYLTPVDPARLTFGQRSDVTTVENKRKALGLDLPLKKQLLYYLRDISPVNYLPSNSPRLDFYNHRNVFNGKENSLILKWPYLRDSYQTGNQVSAMLGRAIPLTIILAFTSFFLATIFGLLFGILSAIYKDTWIDKFIIAFSTLGYSIPSYVSAIFLSVLFGYLLGAFTGLEVQGSLIELNDIGDEQYRWKNLILPSIALGIRPISVITQLMRSSMLDVLSMDYIRTAKAKGLSMIGIVKKHVIKNALNPVVTSLSGWFASLLAGAFFVENVFNYKGLGSMTVNALINYDVPVILAGVGFISLVFILINQFVDVLYKFIDPRLK